MLKVGDVVKHKACTLNDVRHIVLGAPLMGIVENCHERSQCEVRTIDAIIKPYAETEIFVILHRNFIYADRVDMERHWVIL